MEFGPDPILARARAAFAEATRLEHLATEVTIHAALTRARHQTLELSPAVEARLHTLMGRDATVSPLASARDLEPARHWLYDELTDSHTPRPARSCRSQDRYGAEPSP